jgi:HAE1 family hydrophobic/amphiphilic exporter-1
VLESLIDRITRASLRFKWVTITLSILLLLGGIFAVTQLNQELLPKIEFPQSVIFATSQGMELEEMLDQVTVPIEEAVNAIEGVVNYESTTSAGFSVVIVRNEFGVDLEAIRDEITAAMGTIEFPEGMETPELLTFSFADLPVAALSVSSPELNLMELKELVEAEIVPALEQLETVGNVQVSGGQELPTEAPPAPTEAPQPTAEPTAEPTLAPTQTSSETEDKGVPLPDSWIQAAAAQNVTLETTADLTSVMVGAIVNFAPQFLADLTPEMLLATPIDALAALPEEYFLSLDPELQAQLAEMLAATTSEPEPVPLPDSWIQAAAAQNMTIETTADLSPEIVGTIASFAPQMLADLTPEMLLATPGAALAELPETYLETLDADLFAQIEERIASAPAPTETSELPSAWVSAGQTLGITLTQPEDITPEIIQGIVSFAPQMLDLLSPDHLRRFSPESLAWLPGEFITSLDATLQDELDQLALSEGGLGFLAAQAEAQTDVIASDAPALSGSWVQAPEGADPSAGPVFETAADLMNSGFASSASELLSLLVQRGLPEDAVLMADLTPDVIAWLDENEDGFLENLSPSALRWLSPEVLSELPEDFFASLDPALRSELEGIAAGTSTAFIPTDSITRLDGIPSLSMTVFKDSEANTVSVSHAVFDKLDELEGQIPGLRFEIAFEQASFIEESISGVAREGGLGAIFAVIVILIFLSGTVGGKYKLSWRSTLVTAVSIPLSVFMAFALFQWLPPLANTILQPLADATSEIPVLGASTSVLLRLFPVGITLNIMTLSGMTVAIGRVVDDSIVVLENIYRQIQRGVDMKQSVLVGTRDVAIAIFASTVTTVVVFLPIGLLGGLIGEFFLPFGISVTYALASSFLVAVTIVPLLAFLFIRKDQLPEERETTLQRWYTPILRWALSHRGWTLAIAAALFFGSMALLSQRPQAFLPDLGEPQITVNVNMPNGATMAETDEKVAEFEAQLPGVEGLGVILTEVGSGGGLEAAFFGSGIDQGAASMQIGVENTDDIDSRTADVRQLAEETFGKENVLVNSGTLSSGAFGGFALVLSGELADIIAIDDQAIATLESVEGLTNVSSNLTDTEAIMRVDGETAVSYSGELETEDSLGVTQAAKTALLAVVPENITVGEGFQTQQQTQGFAQAMSGVLISIVVVYLAMVVTFRSFVHPFTILFSLPLAVIGASLALWITDRVIGISVMVGLMMLVGIVVTNAIVLLTRVQANRKKRGMDAHEALIEGGRTRLRPILMTAIAAMLALVPLALGLTEGAIIASELATVVIGGLFTSTMLTLLVVPVMYSLLDRIGTRKKPVPVSSPEE